MSKRGIYGEDNIDITRCSHPPKRPRTKEGDGVDRLSSLSDELLLHILSCLPIPSLIDCQRCFLRDRDNQSPVATNKLTGFPFALGCRIGFTL